MLGPLRGAWQSSPALVAITWGPQHRLIFQNDASARAVGARPLDVPMSVAFPEYQQQALEVLEQVRTTGRSVHGPLHEILPLAPGASAVHVRYVISALGTTAPYDGVVMTGIDVSAQVAAERSGERARLLGAVTERMNTATSSDAALKVLAQALVPSVADLAAVYITPPSSAGRNVQTAPPVAIALSEELLAAAGPPPSPQARTGPTPWDAALAAGRTVFIELDVLAHREAVSSASERWLRAAGGRNIVVIPLIMANDLIGALVLLSAGGRRPYVAGDIPFLEDVAARAGTAVAHVRSFQDQRRNALTLQRALLPATPPTLPGVQIAARYLAGADDVEVGGDWWDIHQLDDGTIGLGVGDVSGRGVPAAVLMSQARAGMRFAGHAALPPARVLTVLDRQIHDLVDSTDNSQHRLPARFATAVYALLDPATDQLRVANAGHPPLLIHHHDGTIEQVQAPPGPPLGLGMGGYTERTFTFGPGDLLVAFTDGLIETREIDIDTGTAAVITILTTPAPPSTPHTSSSPSGIGLEDLADRLLALTDGQDDTAILLLRREHPHDTTNPPTLHEHHQPRHHTADDVAPPT